MLATSPQRTRSRVWLQQKLWGSRSQKQAQASLRRELSNLRACEKQEGIRLIRADSRTVQLDSELEFDLASECEDNASLEFLEGVDLVGEEDFEDWLRETRSGLADPTTGRPAPPSASHPEESALSAPCSLTINAMEWTSPRQNGDASLASFQSHLLHCLASTRWLNVNPIGLSPATGDTAHQDCCFALNISLQDDGSQTEVNWQCVDNHSESIAWSDHRLITLSPEEIRLEAARIANCIVNVIEQVQINRSNIRNGRDPGGQKRRWGVKRLFRELSEASIENALQDLQAATNTNEGFRNQCENNFLHSQLKLWQFHLFDRSPKLIDELESDIARLARLDMLDWRGPLFCGMLQVWKGSLRSGESHLKRALELNGSSAEALAFLGSAYSLMGKHAIAEEFLQQAIYIAPLDPLRFFYLTEFAKLQWLSSNFEEAFQLSREALTLYSGYDVATSIMISAAMTINRQADVEHLVVSKTSAEIDTLVTRLSLLPGWDNGALSPLIGDVVSLAEKGASSRL